MSETLPTRLLMALHRPPALRLPNANNHTTRPEIPHAEPPQRTRTPRPLDRADEGTPQGSVLPHVCFTLRRVHLLDIDAKWGSIKDLLDGLQYAGLLDGDREDQITLDVRQEKVGHYTDEETQIEITLP